MKTPFLGGTYKSLSPVLAAQRCVNLRPEVVETGDGKEIAGFYRTSGLRRVVGLITGPCRANGVVVGKYLYTVIGNGLWRISTAFAADQIGILGTRTGPCTVQKNNVDQILLVDGQYAYGYDTRSQTAGDGAVLALTGGTEFGGVPRVNGGTQTGLSLITDGWTHNLALPQGMQFTIAGVTESEFSSTLQVFTLTANVTTSNTGTATLALSPTIVTAPADNALMTLHVVGGAPAVDGANQQGTALATRGWTGGTLIPSGMTFTLRGVFQPSTGVPVTFTTTSTVVATGGGQATLQITPGIAPSGGSQNVSSFGTLDIPFSGAGPTTASVQDGLFLINQSGTQTIWQSNFDDVFTWSGLNFSSEDGQPDPVVNITELQRQQWIFGTKSIAVWVNAGTAGFTFQRLQGVFIEIGCLAPYSVARSADTLFWLGQSDQGGGAIWTSAGYTPKRISTHAIEYALRQYTRLDDARAFCYEEFGHLYYVISFPTGNATWCYDVTTGYWHERAGLANGQLTRWWASGFCFFNGLNIVGDYRNGRLYALDIDEYYDDGQARKWLRAWQTFPPGKTPVGRTKFSVLKVDCQPGVGNPVAPGENPQVMLRHSDDGGQSWSDQRLAGQGKIGETTKSLIWRRLGSSRTRGVNRVWEISGTDPVFEALLSAEVGAEPLR